MTSDNIQIQFQNTKEDIDEERFTAKIELILKELGYGTHEISVVITDNEHIRELNSLYRGIDSPTNVLSFSMLEGEFPTITNMLGDIVISIERAGEEASEYGITLQERLSQLLIHGILHLIGYDHDRDEDSARSMEKKSLELLRMIEKNNELDFF